MWFQNCFVIIIILKIISYFVDLLFYGQCLTLEDNVLNEEVSNMKTKSLVMFGNKIQN